MSNNEITDFEYPYINRTDYIDDSLPKILARDDASKHGFRRRDTFPNVTADDVGMTVWLAGTGKFQLLSIDPEPVWKQLTDDSREATYNDWVIDNYQPKSNVLTSFSRLGSVSNAIPYFNGPSDVQSTGITPLTRNILAASDAPTIRSILGLGSASLLNTPIDGAYIQQGTISKDKIDADFARNLGWTTGDVKLTYKTTADDGWIMLNDGSIGNAGSGATTRANADTYDLFMLMWNIPACPVQTASGVDSTKTTAIQDWSSNKRLVLPKILGRALAAAGQGAGLSNRIIGSSVGKESYTTSGSNVLDLPDGTMIQWGATPGGNLSNNPNNPTYVSLPRPFRTTSYSVVLTIDADGYTHNEHGLYIISRETTRFSAVARGWEGGWLPHSKCNFIAVGK